MATVYQQWPPGPNFIELLSTQMCLAWNFFLRVTNQISTYCILLVTGYSAVVCLSWKSRGNLLGNLVFIKEEISCKQFVVLSSCMKLVCVYLPGRFCSIREPFTCFIFYYRGVDFGNSGEICLAFTLIRM